MTANAFVPLDVETMRATTARLLGDDAELPSEAELNDLVMLCRGHLMLLIPEVEKAACRRPAGDTGAAARAGVGEARRRLDAVAEGPLPRQVAHGQRLARSVVCLLGHLAALGGHREP